jgi:hypothetical protein
VRATAGKREGEEPGHAEAGRQTGGGHRAVVDMEDREDTVEWAHRRIGRGWRAREIWAGEGDRGGGGTHRWRMIFRDTVAAK